MPVTENKNQSKNIDRYDIYNYIKDLIEESPERKAELSSPEIGEAFDIQAATVDYHLKKILKEKLLLVSSKRGKYNKKIYLLPNDTENIKSGTTKREAVQKKVYSPDEIDQFKSMLHQKLNIKNPTPAFEEQVKDTTTEKVEQKVAEAPKQEVKEEAPKMEEETKTSTDSMEFSDKPFSQMEMGKLTLDERIDSFLKQANRIPTANQLLDQGDREILSVLAVSLQEAMNYQKSLTDSLKILEQYHLTTALVDERNALLGKIDELQKSNEALQKQLMNNQGKFDFSPTRVRQQQQIIVSALDTIFNQPNHTLALKRKENYDEITRLVGSMVNYVLNLED